MLIGSKRLPNSPKITGKPFSFSKSQTEGIQKLRDKMKLS